MCISLIIQNRRVQKFKYNIHVTKEQLDELLCAAILAPSAHNNQPWEFIVVTNRDIVNKHVEILLNTTPCKTDAVVIVIGATPKIEVLEDYFPQECGAFA